VLSEIAKQPLTALSSKSYVVIGCIFLSFGYIFVLIFLLALHLLTPTFHDEDNCLWKWLRIKKVFDRIPYCPTHGCQMVQLSRDQITDYYHIDHGVNKEHDAFMAGSAVHDFYEEDQYIITEDSIVFWCPVKHCTKCFEGFRTQPNDTRNNEYFSKMKYRYLTAIDRIELLEKR
jgi:hypothetical protein